MFRSLCKRLVVLLNPVTFVSQITALQRIASRKMFTVKLQKENSLGLHLFEKLFLGLCRILEP